MISPAEAELAIRERVALLPSVTLPLRTLVGAVLREPISATRDQPPFDRVTMDGIAFAYDAYVQGRTSFRVAGIQAAGASPGRLDNTQECIEVMTGAMLPTGCDCVVPVEKIRLQDGYAHLAEDAQPSGNANIHRRGIDCPSGRLLLSPGTRLGPAEIAVIASTGCPEVSVSAHPRIAVISTGDELIEPGSPVLDWQIYRSNAYAVVAALQGRGFSQIDEDHLPDDLATLRKRLRTHLEEHDALILSGGVSMGRFDYIPQVLQELGIEVVFHTIAQRPGKPMWFGVGSGGKAVYALPGNPVSTMVCLARYVYVGLDQARGAVAQVADTVPLGADFQVKPTLTMFLPVSLSRENTRSEGRSGIAQPRPTQGSGDFTSLLGTEGFVELPPGPKLVPRGTDLPFYKW